MNDRSGFFSLPSWRVVAALVLLLTVGSPVLGAETPREVGTRISSKPSQAPLEAPQLPARGQNVQAVDAPVHGVAYTYDANGRLTAANYGGGVMLVYGYDPAGNLVRVTDHLDVYLVYMPVVLR